MAEPFMGEIRIMSFGFAPKGWATCDGQSMLINQNQALFLLLGTTFGGDGQTNFALPDLRARTPVHVGNGHTLGERGGQQAHTLSIQEIPTHVHAANASTSNGNTAFATNNVLAGALNLYRPPSNLTALKSDTVTNVGGSQAHLNLQPFLTLS